jgi:two-component system chemotaxis response regulator CheB
MMKAPEKKIRVLVADDSAFMCKVLKEIINSDAQLEVAGTARDGREAVALAESLRPDVITMDINMPHLDGLQATELIMSQHPRPIVIVSSESREGASGTLRALELGAIDFVPKPSSGIDLDMKSVREDLTRKLKMAAKVRVVRTATLSRLPATHAPVSLPANSTGTPALHGTGGKVPIVVIAASTGGPAAVMRVVAGLPKDLQAAVLLVLHMPAAFTKQFTIQLAEISQLPVKEAESNEPTQAGMIYLCPGANHLRLSSIGKIALDGGPRIEGYRPCADVALETVAAYARPLTVAVVLTGMGNDAANGVLVVKAAGGDLWHAGGSD